MSARLKGTIIAALGVLAATPDALLVRWAKELGAATAQLLFWRLVSSTLWGALMMALLSHINGENLTSFLREASRGAGYLALSTALQTATSVAVPLAFVLTYAANVMLCLSMSPLFAALVGFAVLRDKLPTRTVAAVAAAVVSMIVMFLPGILSAKGETDSDEATSVGDSLALLASVTTALYITTARAVALRQPEVPVESATALAAAAAALIVAGVIKFRGEGLFDGTSPLFFLAMTLNGFGLAAIYFSFSVAPRYISGAQVALISLLETILGPLYVFLIYDQVPPTSVLYGGTILLLAVFTHEVLALREDYSQEQASFAVKEAVSSYEAVAQHASPHAHVVDVRS